MKTPAIVYVRNGGRVGFSAQIDASLFQFFAVEEPSFAEKRNVGGLNRWTENVFNTMDELDAYAEGLGFVKQTGFIVTKKNRRK